MRSSIALTLLGGLAILAPAADFLDAPALRGLAAASGASPAMKVFTSHDGYETFSPRFHIEYASKGEKRVLTLTPETYKRLRGPYNRRNAYGAALSYSPVLVADPKTRAMHAAVVDYALCGAAPVLGELGITDVDTGTPIVVRIDPRRRLDAKWQLEHRVYCDD